MALDLTALSNYTKQEETNLISTSILGSKTISLIKQGGRVYTGIKSSEQIPIGDTDVVFQAGGTCGFTPQGTTTIAQRPLNVGKLRVMEALCPKELERTFMQQALPVGSKYETVPFEQWYTERKVAKIHAALEVAVWRGDTASGNANLNKFDGFIKLIAAAGTPGTAGAPANGNPGAVTSVTQANIIDVLLGIYGAIPVEVLAAMEENGDGYGFIPQEWARFYTAALFKANLFHYYKDESGIAEFVLPGTNFRFVPIPGLNGTNKAYAMRLSNMMYGTDLENEEEKFELSFAKEADQVRFDAEWKSGVNFVFASEIVAFNLA